MASTCAGACRGPSCFAACPDKFLGRLVDQSIGHDVKVKNENDWADAPLTLTLTLTVPAQKLILTPPVTALEL
jgi:hypothetical protein